VRWTYCEKWNGLLVKPLTPIDEDEARRRHDSGELYTAVGEEAGRPRVLVHVRLGNQYVGVKFLDDLGRDALIYNFRLTDRRMFLRKIINYTYGDEPGVKGRVPLIVETLTYAPDGVVRRETDDSRLDTVKVQDYDSVDVTTHWESVPSFGEYESITRWDRE
jgi:hypothetical protein